MRISTIILLAGAGYLASSMGYLPDYRDFHPGLIVGALVTAGVMLVIKRA